MGKRKFKKRRGYVGVENPQARFRKMTRDHADVLQNIEAVLVAMWREDGAVDDRAVATALKAAISGSEPVEPVVRRLTNELAAVRVFRADVPDMVWTDGLKVVLESVHTHSERKTGDRDYLDFVSQFIA